MAKNSRDDNRNFIITSKYKHKSTKLSNFVEKEVVDRFESYQFSDTSSQVENRKEARKWLEKVKNTALESMSNISQYRKDGKNPPEFDALIEEERLKVLHEIGWSYTDNFITRKKTKKDPSDTSTSDPETSFMISTEEIGNVLYYRASYGIVRGVANKSIGNYTYALTLDEALKFIRREFETSGKTAMSRKLLEAKKRQLKMERSDRRLNGNDLSQEVEKELGKVWNPDNINKVIKRVQDSADITTIADFIEFFLAPIARKMHYEAYKHEKELQGAQRIQDKNMIDLDKRNDSIPEESVVKLKPTTRTNSEGVEEKRFIPVDRNDRAVAAPAPVVEKEENVEVDNIKDNNKPTTVPPIHPFSESVKKSIKNSERVQIRKPLLPPVPSLPLINDENGVDLDATTDQVEETLNIDKVGPSVVGSDNIEETTAPENNDVVSDIEEDNAPENDSIDSQIEETTDVENNTENSKVEEDSTPENDIEDSKIEEDSTPENDSTDSHVEENTPLVNITEEDSVDEDSETRVEDNIEDDSIDIEESEDENSDVNTSETTEDTVETEDSIVEDSPVNSEAFIEENTEEDENSKDSQDGLIEKSDDEVNPELSRVFSVEETPEEPVVYDEPVELVDTEDSEIEESTPIEKEGNITIINREFPEFIDNREYDEDSADDPAVKENTKEDSNIEDAIIQEVVDNTIIADDSDGSASQELVEDVEEDNIPEEEEVRDDFIDEGDIESEEIQEEVSNDVVEDDYIQPVEVSDEIETEGSLEPIEDIEEADISEDEYDYITLPSDEEEIEEIVEEDPEPRISDDIIDEFDDFLQDEEELMRRGEEINSALDDFNSEDITSILKDSIPELFDVTRMPVREDDGRAEEINNMMDDFLDFDDDFYDEDEDR